MLHQIRWTAEKIGQRLALLETFVYRRRQELPPFRLHLVPDTEDAPPLFLQNIDDNSWPQIEANSYWAPWSSNFTLRTRFQCDFETDEDCSVALWLPLGDSYDFSHPEALIYIDETPLAACDRNHREVLLPERYCDGQPHLLVLEGWTGLGKLPPLPAGSQLLMGN